MKKVIALFRGFDGLLRGETTEHSPQFHALIRAIFLLGGFYGVCMGLYAALRGSYGTGWQMLASAGKIPMLFLLTLLVTFPSLYVFSALSRSSLRFREALLVLVRAIAVSIVLLASFGPITAFFTLSTESYPFIVLLNVAFFAASGFVGLAVLRRTLVAVFDAPATTARGGGGDTSRRVFGVWIVVYGAVGAQMGWILRPFIGTPARPFELFRERGSNFFEAVLEAFGQLFGR